MNDLVTRDAEFTVENPNELSVRNAVCLTLTAELGGDRFFPLSSLDLSFDSAEDAVFTAVGRALAEDGVLIPRGSYAMSRNANSQTISLYPKSQFGAR